MGENDNLSHRFRRELEAHGFDNTVTRVTQLKVKSIEFNKRMKKIS